MWQGIIPALQKSAMATLQSIDKTKLLFAAGVAGVAATGICSAKATPEALSRSTEIEFDSYQMDWNNERERKSYVLKRKLVEVAPLYLPAVGCGALAVACFGMSNKQLVAKAAASAALAGTLEKALESYSEKTLEVAGEEVHQKIKQAVADDIPDEVMEKARGYLTEADVANMYAHGAHDVLWYDKVTDRIFWSTEAKILDAESKVNQQIIQEQVATISDFYANLFLESEGSALRALGWDSGDSYVDSMSIVFGSRLDPETHIPMNSIYYNWKVIYPHEGSGR